MRWLVESKNGKTAMLAARLLTPTQLKVVTSPTAWRILQLLVKKASYPKELGRQLKVNEQKLYYHIHRLESAGLIKKVREEMRQGAVAKFYAVAEPAFALVLKELEPATKLFSVPQAWKDYLEPFVRDGRFDALIVIGNPEPHGPTTARGHDFLYAVDMALFFGTMLSRVPASSIKFDTDVREPDLKHNLILVGGPGVNSITAKVNSKLPIKFVQVALKNNYFTRFQSSVSGKTYSEENYAVIEKIKNPWDRSKAVLVIAGRRYFGTRAAVLAMTQHFDKVVAGNSYRPGVHARVIDGIDMDGDGEIDTIEFLE